MRLSERNIREIYGFRNEMPCFKCGRKFDEQSIVDMPSDQVNDEEVLRFVGHRHFRKNLIFLTSIIVVIFLIRLECWIAFVLFETAAIIASKTHNCLIFLLFQFSNFKFF